jgi:hypothetical protein
MGDCRNGVPPPTPVETQIPNAEFRTPLANATLLQPVLLRPIPNARNVSFGAALFGIALALLAAAVVGYENRLTLTQSLVAARVAAAPPVQTVALQRCYQNSAWTPPAPDLQGAHLQSDPRYRAVDLTKVHPERVHVESGPFRSSSAFGDFVTLSGVWSDAGWQSMPCSSDLLGKAEVWGLALHFDAADLQEGDLTVHAATTDAGLEIIQLVLPGRAEALHILDQAGQKLIPDVNLGSH